jgi:hypothetical protein
MTADILGVDGEILHEFVYQRIGDGGVYWLTDNVLVSFSRYVNQYCQGPRKMVT